MITSIYIAGPFKRREDLFLIREQLAQRHIESTSRWLDSHLSDYDCPVSVLRQEALEDLLDIHRADAFLLVNPEEWVNEGRGGKHIEFGYALAKGRAMYVMGVASSIFHHHPNVKVIQDISEI